MAMQKVPHVKRWKDEEPETIPEKAMRKLVDPTYGRCEKCKTSLKLVENQLLGGPRKQKSWFKAALDDLFGRRPEIVGIVTYTECPKCFDTYREETILKDILDRIDRMERNQK